MRRLLPALALLIACSNPPEPRPAPAPAASVAPPPAASASAPAPVAMRAVARVPVSEQDLSWGDPQAPVTAVLFGEIGLGGTERVLKKLNAMQASMGEKTLRIVWKSFARQAIPHAQKLAQIVAATAQTDGAEVGRKLLEALLADPTSNNDINKVMEKARAAGVKDAAALEKRFTSDEFLPRIQEELELGVKLNVEQAPTVFVNGYQLSGRVKEIDLRNVINDEREKVEELLKTGKKIGEVYALRTQQNSNNEKKYPWGRPPLEGGQSYRVELGDSPASGPADALVTVVLFAGYQDPFTNKLLPDLRKVLQRHKKEARLVWKDAPLPFHPYATALAALGLEARDQGGDAAFFKAIDKLNFHNSAKVKHKKLDDPKNQGPFLDALGRDLGLKKKGSEAAALEKHLKHIEADKKLMETRGVTGTPTTFFNGEPINGARGEPELEEAFKRALERAQAKVKAGVKPDKVYEALMQEARSAEED